MAPNYFSFTLACEQSEYLFRIMSLQKKGKEKVVPTSLASLSITFALKEGICVVCEHKCYDLNKEQICSRCLCETCGKALNQPDRKMCPRICTYISVVCRSPL